MVDTDYVPDRGEIIWINFSPQAGREQAGRRPALVLSPARYNAKSQLALCCPITSRVKGYPFEVPLTQTDGVAGVVLADQVRSLDWLRRDAQFQQRASPQVWNEVLVKIQSLLT